MKVVRSPVFALKRLLELLRQAKRVQNFGVQGLMGRDRGQLMDAAAQVVATVCGHTQLEKLAVVVFQIPDDSKMPSKIPAAAARALCQNGAGAARPCLGRPESRCADEFGRGLSTQIEVNQYSCKHMPCGFGR